MFIFASTGDPTGASHVRFVCPAERHLDLLSSLISSSQTTITEVGCPPEVTSIALPLFRQCGGVFRGTNSAPEEKILGQDWVRHSLCLGVSGHLGMVSISLAGETNNKQPLEGDSGTAAPGQATAIGTELPLVALLGNLIPELWPKAVEIPRRQEEFTNTGSRTST